MCVGCHVTCQWSHEGQAASAVRRDGTLHSAPHSSTRLGDWHHSGRPHSALAIVFHTFVGAGTLYTAVPQRHRNQAITGCLRFDLVFK